MVWERMIAPYFSRNTHHVHPNTAEDDNSSLWIAKESSTLKFYRLVDKMVLRWWLSYSLCKVRSNIQYAAPKLKASQQSNARVVAVRILN